MNVFVAIWWRLVIRLCNFLWHSRDSRREYKAAARVWVTPIRWRCPTARRSSSRDISRCMTAGPAPSYPWTPTPWTSSMAPTLNIRGRRHWRRTLSSRLSFGCSPAQEAAGTSVWRTTGELACSRCARRCRRCLSSTSRSKSCGQRNEEPHQTCWRTSGMLNRRSTTRWSGLGSKTKDVWWFSWEIISIYSQQALEVFQLLWIRPCSKKVQRSSGQMGPSTAGTEPSWCWHPQGPPKRV